MTTQQAINKAGSIRKLALLLNITTTAIYAWKGTVPELRQFQIEKLKGKKNG